MRSRRELAGSHLQLMAQLRGAGVADDGLALVRDAYELDMQLFSAQYRRSGVPFLGHLVRTASIVADQGASPQVIAASLLHAAYSHGDFGFAERKLSERKRRIVRDCVTAPVESLVARYAVFPWHVRAADRRAPAPDEVAGMDTTDRTVLLMRLCNELEEHLDLADLHSPGFRAQGHRSPTSLERLQRACSQCRELAEALGRTELAGEFSAVWDEIAAAQVSDACVVAPRLRLDVRLHAPRGEAAAYWLPPASLRRRPVVWLRESLRDVPWLRAIYRLLRRSA